VNIETQFSQFAIQIFYLLLYGFQDIRAIKFAGIWIRGGRLNLIIGMPGLCGMGDWIELLMNMTL